MTRKVREMRTYRVTITGTFPLLMHADNIEWADEMEAWKNDPASKKKSKAGDDRSPAHRWIGSVYHDGKVVGIPNDNLMRALMEGGAMVPVPGGKNGKTSVTGIPVVLEASKDRPVQTRARAASVRKMVSER